MIDAAEEKARARCLIQSGSHELKLLDFHSFRRQFNTALAAIFRNVQQPMALAGRKSTGNRPRSVQNVVHLSVQGFGVDVPLMVFVTTTPVPVGLKLTLPGPVVTLV